MLGVETVFCGNAAAVDVARFIVVALDAEEDG